jgi:hypothetical protein
MTMSRPLNLFVSSSPDLAAEREALGQAVAGLPISLGWEIRHTPLPNEDASAALAFIAGCDLGVVMLGADFAAPMGLEWQAIHSAGKRLLAYRKRTLYSPSAERLLRRSGVAWTSFDTPQELKTHVTLTLAQIVLDHGEEFGLHLDDVESLLALLEAQKEPDTGDEPDRRRGAGQSGVILSRGT